MRIHLSYISTDLFWTKISLANTKVAFLLWGGNFFVCDLSIYCKSQKFFPIQKICGSVTKNFFLIFTKSNKPPTGKEILGRSRGRQGCPPATPRRQWVPREPPMPPITMGVSHRPSHRSPAPKGALEKKGAPNHVILRYVGGPLALTPVIPFIRGDTAGTAGWERREKIRQLAKQKSANWQTRNSPTGKTEMRQLANNSRALPRAPGMPREAPKPPTIMGVPHRPSLRQPSKGNAPTGKLEIH
jgi:hypothetical protein